MAGASSSQVIVCGKTGGYHFKNVTQGDVDGNCPDDYTACIADAKPENTICYNSTEYDDGYCPITGIQMIISDVSQTYEDLGYTVVSFNDTCSIAYTKQEDSLPPTSI